MSDEADQKGPSATKIFGNVPISLRILHTIYPQLRSRFADPSGDLHVLSPEERVFLESGPIDVEAYRALAALAILCWYFDVDHHDWKDQPSFIKTVVRKHRPDAPSFSHDEYIRFCATCARIATEYTGSFMFRSLDLPSDVRACVFKPLTRVGEANDNTMSYISTPLTCQFPAMLGPGTRRCVFACEEETGPTAPFFDPFYYPLPESARLRSDYVADRFYRMCAILNGDTTPTRLKCTTDKNVVVVSADGNSQPVHSIMQRGTALPPTEIMIALYGDFGWSDDMFRIAVRVINTVTKVLNAPHVTFIGQSKLGRERIPERLPVCGVVP